MAEAFFGGHGLFYLAILAASFVLSLVFTQLARRLGVRLGLVATPGGRRRHQGVVSRLGGVGIAAGFFGALALAQAYEIPTADHHETRRLWGLIIGGALMFILGLLDDRLEFPAWTQYLSYLLAAGVAIGTLIILEQFNNPLTGKLINLPWFLYMPLTVFWITGMIVTVNWLDGLDGLAIGVTAIMAVVLALHMIRMVQYSVAPQAIALLGAALGFLVFNLHPAKIHMGSSGAFLVGYLLAALGLIAGARVAMVLMVMGIPVIDVAWTIIDRIRHGRRPTEGDRRHLHYRLQDAGLSTRTIVALYWLFCAMFGALALVLSHSLYKLLALSVLGVLTLVLLLFLSRDDASPPPF
ncbi:MAG: undecaprenyl/decaprenyl-phosphate alpha-N-acetylglucosaminyl 1-phosphate transferase [Anaerolineae bacterium]|nr:undecaprenyl/decaprenyl-phosphate alpha-N-acetylglucosaminyl 1-phosphate transferase [Anaerolineae bacterium]